MESRTRDLQSSNVESIGSCQIIQVKYLDGWPFICKSRYSKQPEVCVPDKTKISK